MPDPYIIANPNELIRAVDWNNLQIQARTEIQGHGHTGIDDGVQIGTDGIADDAIDTTKIADDAVTTAEISDNAVTTAKLASSAVTSAEISQPAALDVTGSTVEGVPLAPYFDHFSISSTHFQTTDIAEADNNILATNISALLTSLVSGTDAATAATPNIVPLLHTIVDNVPRDLIEELGLASAHQEVGNALPAYASQLASLSDPAGVTSALDILGLIEAEGFSTSRSFAYAFVSRIGRAIASAGGAESLIVTLNAEATIGNILTALVDSTPSLLSGVMAPLTQSSTLRFAPPDTDASAALMRCDATLSLSFQDTLLLCAVGIGSETLPPPPNQVTYVPSGGAMDLASIVRTAFARRTSIFLPSLTPGMTRSARLWGVILGPGAAFVINGRLDCRDVILRQYGDPTVVAAADSPPWNDAPDGGVGPAPELPAPVA